MTGPVSSPDLDLDAIRAWAAYPNRRTFYNRNRAGEYSRDVEAERIFDAALVLVGQLQDENRRLQLHLDEWQSTDAIEQAVQRRRDSERIRQPCGITDEHEPHAWPKFKPMPHLRNCPGAVAVLSGRKEGE